MLDMMQRIRALEKLASITFSMAQRIIQLTRELGIRQTRGGGDTTTTARATNGRRKKRKVATATAKTKVVRKKRGAGKIVKTAKYGPDDAEREG